MFTQLVEWFLDLLTTGLDTYQLNVFVVQDPCQMSNGSRDT